MNQNRKSPITPRQPIKISRRKTQRSFRETRKTERNERWYQGKLITLVKEIQRRIDDLKTKSDYDALDFLYEDLDRLSTECEEWAKTVATKMLKQASKADYDTWLEVGAEMTREVKELLRNETVGVKFSELQQSQVDLITSLPRLASEKVHEWAEKAMSNGERFDDLADEIAENWRHLGHAHAVLIARTETARARANFTQARAQMVGSEGYIWRTAQDGRVRETHAKLDGTFHRWDEPPICDISASGEVKRAHPGTIYNCRCFAVPLFPKDLLKK